MTATVIVFVFSALSSASKGSHDSLRGLLVMLSVCRSVSLLILNAFRCLLESNSFLLGIGIGAEYPCGSVAASEQTEEEGIAKNAQNRWFALATSEFWIE